MRVLRASRLSISGTASTTKLPPSRRRGEVNKWQADYLMQTRDGRRIWVSDISYPWFGADGAIIGSIGSLRDITDRVEAEARARAEAESLLRQTLEKQQRVLGPEHPDTFVTITVLAAVCEAQDRPWDSEMMLMQLWKLQKRVLDRTTSKRWLRLATLVPCSVGRDVMRRPSKCATSI